LHRYVPSFLPSCFYTTKYIQVSPSLYIFAFQMKTSPSVNSTNPTPTSAIAYKLASNSENAGAAAILKITTDKGYIPVGAPSVTWSPLGGPNGTIVLSDSKSTSVFINQALGQGSWREVKTNVGRSLGREVRVRKYYPVKRSKGRWLICHV
jgi:hypothetical protein